MIRLLSFAALAAILTGSAIFRLSAEHQVRMEARAIAKLERQEAQLQAEIDRLQFEVEVLESAPRLNELSQGRLPLAPGSGRQLADGDVLLDVIDPAARMENRP
ncbi:FtsB/FtsL family cell division protein [Parvularcula lutaonensis]|uniref:Cell division protein FtsL n=1 Tax=Parvularcula lutaonensis TaxID=491923 RepID=A0ABV7M8C2_9PROT|nr:cell division protein FtsL [Parvularcula lutaonensis]GGY41681.1 hypothetical protein GCM10007148_07850 [Parvularcula lutaonensis]